MIDAILGTCLYYKVFTVVLKFKFNGTLYLHLKNLMILPNLRDLWVDKAQ